MIDLIKHESVYRAYYLGVQIELIAQYWALGILIGSIISVFGKNEINRLFLQTKRIRMGVFGLVPASVLGIISPLCMYETIPIAASFSENGAKDDVLAAFMMSSILLNPQLVFSAPLSDRRLRRFSSCFQEHEEKMY